MQEKSFRQNERQNCGMLRGLAFFFYCISRGNARDEMGVQVRAISSHHLICIHFLRLTRALCRSLVVEGSAARSWFLSSCSSRVSLAAPGIARVKKNLPWHAFAKDRNWPIWQAANGDVADEGPSLRTCLLWKVGVHVQSEDQCVFVCGEPPLFS